jgi:hypothetical protein
LKFTGLARNVSPWLPDRRSKRKERPEKQMKRVNQPRVRIRSEA